MTFNTSPVWDKIHQAESVCYDLLNGRIHDVVVPELPARDIEIRDSRQHPPKLGFSLKEGQARMLHDLASIELQALELGVRTLVEYPDAPQGFREELAAVTISEAQHLRLCLEAIQDLGFSWGHWPVHCALWTAVSSKDSLLDRILIVHRYLEGSGLDAGDALLRRLAGVDSKPVESVVRQINTEEIGHVEFGSRWYRNICQQEGIDPNDDFFKRMSDLREQLPKRIEKVNRDLRLKAGFTPDEITYFEKLREDFLIPLAVRQAQGLSPK